jgi:hypothetical protein
MLNGDFLNDQAETLASRLRREAGDDPAAQVSLGLRLATSRTPSAEEVRRGVDLMAALRSRDGATPGDARKAFALVVLNLNEFLYVD